MSLGNFSRGVAEEKAFGNECTRNVVAHAVVVADDDDDDVGGIGGGVGVFTKIINVWTSFFLAALETKKKKKTDKKKKKNDCRTTNHAVSAPSACRTTAAEALTRSICRRFRHQLVTCEC